MLSYLMVAGEAATVSTVTDALKTALSSAGSDMLGVISATVPVVIPVMIGVAAVSVGIKIFKLVTGRN